MKKTSILLILLFSNSIFSQEDTTIIAQKPIVAPLPKDTVVIRDTSWKTNGFLGLNLSQTALSNWQGGGQDNISINGILTFEAIYKKGKNEWNNKLDCQYGMVKPASGKLFKKNVDQILAITKYDRATSRKYWFYSVAADFRSQFAPGYNYNDAGDSIVGKPNSNWLAPAYIQLALGVDFKIKDYFSASLSPIAGKVTVVNDQTLADNGAYGVEPAVFDTSGVMITHGKKFRYEFGGRFTLKFKKELGKNVTVDTYFDLFSNYMHHPENIDVVWNTLITFKINKFLSATLSTKVLYDDDIMTMYDWNKDGKYDNVNDINGPRLQVLTNFGVGLGYKF